MAEQSVLEIKDLHVAVEGNEVIRGVTMTIKQGEIHALLGPNGAGKSTLGYAIMGHPKYEITGGEVLLDGENLLEMEADERSRAGLFLAFQYPVSIPGVTVANFLRTAKTALDGQAPKVRTWPKVVSGALTRLEMDPDFATRSVNEGFSGGEKKRGEIVQLDVLNPKVAVLDEIDSGLDIDAVRIVADGINRYAAQGDRGVLLITHYTRILRYIEPTHVHVFVNGQIVESGGKELADELEISGYDKYVKAVHA